jgi:hypothetical protein
MRIYIMHAGKRFVLDSVFQASWSRQRDILNNMLPSFVVDQMLIDEYDQGGRR